MRLRPATTGMLVGAAIVFAAVSHAQAFDLPLQLNKFLNIGRAAKTEPQPQAQPAEEAAKTAPVHKRRHVARRPAEKHVAAAPAEKHVAAAPAEKHVAAAPAARRHERVKETREARHEAPAPAETAPSVASPVAPDSLPGPASPAPAPVVTATSEPAAAPASDEPAEQYVNGVRVVSAGEFNELDAAADRVKIVAANEVNEIDLAAGPAIGTDGRNPDSPPPAEGPVADFLTWPRLLAFGLGAPLLIGLLAWPLIARRRSDTRAHYRWST